MRSEKRDKKARSDKVGLSLWLHWQLLIVSCRHGATGEKDEERGSFPVGQLGARRGKARDAAAFEAAFQDVLAGRTVKGVWGDRDGGKHLALLTHLGPPTGACHGISYARLPSSPRRVLGAPVSVASLSHPEELRQARSCHREAVRRRTPPQRLPPRILPSLQSLDLHHARRRGGEYKSLYLLLPLLIQRSCDRL